jgi:hypothetical protein
MENKNICSSLQKEPCGDLGYGGYKMKLTDQGTLVLLNKKNNPVWKNIEHHLYLQADGNLVINNSLGFVLWETNTRNMGVAPYNLKIDDDANIKIYDSVNNVIWSSNINFISLVNDNIDDNASHIIGKLQTLILNYGEYDHNLQLREGMVIASAVAELRKGQHIQASNIWCPLIWRSLALCGYNIPPHFYNVEHILEPQHIDTFNAYCLNLIALHNYSWCRYAVYCLLNFDKKNLQHMSLPEDITDYTPDLYIISDMFSLNSQKPVHEGGPPVGPIGPIAAASFGAAAAAANWQKKYLKYKLKYLQLKNNLS